MEEIPFEEMEKIKEDTLKFITALVEREELTDLRDLEIIEKKPQETPDEKKKRMQNNILFYVRQPGIKQLQAKLKEMECNFPYTKRYEPENFGKFKKALGIVFKDAIKERQQSLTPKERMEECLRKEEWFKKFEGFGIEKSEQLPKELTEMGCNFPYDERYDPKNFEEFKEALEIIVEKKVLEISIETQQIKEKLAEMGFNFLYGEQYEPENFGKFKEVLKILFEQKAEEEDKKPPVITEKSMQECFKKEKQLYSIKFQKNREEYSYLRLPGEIKCFVITSNGYEHSDIEPDSPYPDFYLHLETGDMFSFREMGALKIFPYQNIEKTPKGKKAILKFEDEQLEEWLPKNATVEYTKENYSECFSIKIEPRGEFKYSKQSSPEGRFKFVFTVNDSYVSIQDQDFPLSLSQLTQEELEKRFENLRNSGFMHEQISSGFMHEQISEEEKLNPKNTRLRTFEEYMEEKKKQSEQDLLELQKEVLIKEEEGDTRRKIYELTLIRMNECVKEWLPEDAKVTYHVCSNYAAFQITKDNVNTYYVEDVLDKNKKYFCTDTTLLKEEIEKRFKNLAGSSLRETKKAWIELIAEGNPFKEEVEDFIKETHKEEAIQERPKEEVKNFILPERSEEEYQKWLEEAHKEEAIRVRRKEEEFQKFLEEQKTANDQLNEWLPYIKNLTYAMDNRGYDYFLLELSYGEKVLYYRNLDNQYFCMGETLSKEEIKKRFENLEKSSIGGVALSEYNKKPKACLKVISEYSKQQRSRQIKQQPQSQQIQQIQQITNQGFNSQQFSQDPNYSQGFNSQQFGQQIYQQPSQPQTNYSQVFNSQQFGQQIYQQPSQPQTNYSQGFNSQQFSQPQMYLQQPSQQQTNYTQGFNSQQFSQPQMYLQQPSQQQTNYTQGFNSQQFGQNQDNDLEVAKWLSSIAFHEEYSSKK